MSLGQFINILYFKVCPPTFSLHSHTFSRPKDEKADNAEAHFEAAPIVASSSSRGDTSMPEEVFPISSSFWEKWHSPDKKKEENKACTDMVVWTPPLGTSLKRQNAKEDLEIGEDRPQFRRQMAKSTFNLDSSDMQTLALALESKALENQQSSQVKKSTPKKKAAAKGTTAKKASTMIHKKPSMSAKEKKKKKKTESEPHTPSKKKSSFRHRKTSTAYHHAKNIALKAGHSPNTAAAKGREASGAVSLQIDTGVLKEEDEQ